MFGTIRKHQTWLWAIIIVLMSIGLVVFFSPDATIGGGGRNQGRDYGSIGGRPIPPGPGREMEKEALLVYFFRNNGNWPNNDEQAAQVLDNLIVQRYFLSQKMKEFGINPSENAVAVQMRQQIGDMPLPEFEQRFLASKGLTAEDYKRYVRNEVGQQQLMSAAGISGKFVRPGEAEPLYRKENQETEAQLAVFWASNYMDKVVITNGAIGAFYTNRAQFTYRVPERTILSYVEFPATNYFAEADKEIGSITNIDARLTEIYVRRNTNDPFFLDDKGVPLAEADAKKKLQQQHREALGRDAAHRAANEFGSALIDPRSTPGLDPDPNKLSNFEKLAALKGIPVKTSKPFDALSGLEEFDAPTNFLLLTEENFRATVRKAASELKESNPIRFNPLVGPHAVFIIARKGTLPPETPPLENVTDKITNDYKLVIAQDLARKAGAAFGTNVTNGLTLGKPFADIAKAESVKVVDVPPFSDTTQSLTNFDSRIPLGMLQRLSRDLKVGEASHFQPFSQEGSLVLYVKGRPKLDDAKVQAALPEYINQLRLYRQFEAFNQWFQKQATDARLALPKRTNETAAVAN